MEMVISNHFQCEDLESSNGNNHLFNGCFRFQVIPEKMTDVFLKPSDLLYMSLLVSSISVGGWGDKYVMYWLFWSLKNLVWRKSSSYLLMLEVTMNHVWKKNVETPTKAEWNLPVHKDWNQHKNHTSKNPPSVNKSKVLANLSQISWKNNVGMAMKSHLLFLQRQVGHAFFFHHFRGILQEKKPVSF